MLQLISYSSILFFIDFSKDVQIIDPSGRISELPDDNEESAKKQLFSITNYEQLVDQCFKEYSHNFLVLMKYN